MYTTGYSESGTWIDLLLSTVSHVSLLHYSKNATLLILCASVMIYYGIPARWLGMLAVAVPANYCYAHAFGSVMGASGGTFALLGVMTVVAYRREQRLTIALVPLLAHQLLIADPTIALTHGVAWIVGVGAYVTVARNSQFSFPSLGASSLESMK